MLAAFGVALECGHLPMEIEQRKYGLRIAATEAAFARNAEFGPMPLRSFHPRTRPPDAIGEMNSPR